MLSTVRLNSIQTAIETESVENMDWLKSHHQCKKNRKNLHIVLLVDVDQFLNVLVSLPYSVTLPLSIMREWSEYGKERPSVTEMCQDRWFACEEIPLLHPIGLQDRDNFVYRVTIEMKNAALEQYQSQV